ncbi:MAG TPA: DUF1003 domain-containing protein [Candidatus Dormibacteraeota bacterium]|jgi:uncharacterized membrane protein|nr:DUF1003 domain-containing protein [Candidatus Dormibacteraeota bacterium]
MAQDTSEAPPGIESARSADILHRLRRKHRDPEADHKHPVNVTHYETASLGERLADQLSAAMGSWPFIIVQSCLLVVWVYLNVWAVFIAHWDAYPFILLNLVLSFQATYAGPIVLLAGNRQSQKDRITLEHAADESDKGEVQINRILVEIRKNTALTLQILNELEAENA